MESTVKLNLLNCNLLLFSIKKNRLISESVFISELLLLFRRKPYFTLFTIASKASGLFIAKSARTLRFNSILLALSFPMNFE